MAEARGQRAVAAAVVSCGAPLDVGDGGGVIVLDGIHDLALCNLWRRQTANTVAKSLRHAVTVAPPRKRSRGVPHHVLQRIAVEVVHEVAVDAGSREDIDDGVGEAPAWWQCRLLQRGPRTPPRRCGAADPSATPRGGLCQRTGTNLSAPARRWRCCPRTCSL